MSKECCRGSSPKVAGKQKTKKNTRTEFKFGAKAFGSDDASNANDTKYENDRYDFGRHFTC
jgi:hypothetical protein